MLQVYGKSELNYDESGQYTRTYNDECGKSGKKALKVRVLIVKRVLNDWNVIIKNEDLKTLKEKLNEKQKISQVFFSFDYSIYFLDHQMSLRLHHCRVHQCSRCCCWMCS